MNLLFNLLKILLKPVQILVEFRIDAMDHPNPDDVLNIIKDINHPLIATNRRIDEGGFFKGSESERTEILLTAAKHADIIDIELETDVRSHE